SGYFIKACMDAMGVNQNYLFKWKNDLVRPPTYIELAKLAAFLERPVEIFIYGKEEEPHVKIPVKDYKATAEAIRNLAEAQLTHINKKVV
ncbi:MAG: hypothetical protein ABJI69_09870, partial [Balneola sp.]